MRLCKTALAVVLCVSIFAIFDLAEIKGQLPGPPAGVCPEKFAANYFGFYLYETVQCPDSTPTNYLFAYDRELDPTELGCDGEGCNIGDEEPVFTLVFMPLAAKPETGDKSKNSKREQVIKGTQLLRSVLSKSSKKLPSIKSGSTGGSSKLNVFFDDLVVRADLFDGTTKYYCCLSAIYRRDALNTIPVMLAIEIDDPGAGRVDGIGRLVLDVSTFQLKLDYEVEIGLGAHKTRKTLSFLAPALSN